MYVRRYTCTCNNVNSTIQQYKVSIVYEQNRHTLLIWEVFLSPKCECLQAHQPLPAVNPEVHVGSEQTGALPVEDDDEVGMIHRAVITVII